MLSQSTMSTSSSDSSPHSPSHSASGRTQCPSDRCIPLHLSIFGSCSRTVYRWMRSASQSPRSHGSSLPATSTKILNSRSSRNSSTTTSMEPSTSSTPLSSTLILATRSSPRISAITLHCLSLDPPTSLTTSAINPMPTAAQLAEFN